MTELNENIKNELNDLFSSMEKSSSDIEKKFKSLLEDFIQQSWNNFDEYLQNDARYGYERWIRQTCNEIIEGLLSGETKWLKNQNIISEYNWEKIQKIRLKIWETAGGEIANSTIKALQDEVERLKKDVKHYREMAHRSY